MDELRATCGNFSYRKSFSFQSFHPFVGLEISQEKRVVA
jgi:hypothetical protein